MKYPDRNKPSKLFLLLIAVFLGTFSVQAQTYLIQESFEGTNYYWPNLNRFAIGGNQNNLFVRIPVGQAYNAYQGTYAVQCSPDNHDTFGNHSYLQTADFYADSGATYRLRFYKKGYNATHTERLQVLFYHGGSRPDTLWRDTLLSNTTYQLVELTFASPADTNINIAFDAFSHYPQGYMVYLDSISLARMPAAPCSGMPQIASVQVNKNFLCPGDTVRLSIAGPTVDKTITWQSSADSGITWSTITSAANKRRYEEILTGTRIYRVILTCPVSGLSSTSALVLVRKKQPTECYCSPTYDYYCNRVPYSGIGSFSVTGEQSTFINDGLNCTEDRVDDHTIGRPPLIMYTGATYTLNTDVNYANWDKYRYKVWIDFNNNGQFELSESVFYHTADVYSRDSHMPLVIPVGAPSGVFRMRAMKVLGYAIPDLSTLDACAHIERGHTVDYMADIQSPQVPSNDKPVNATPLTPGSGCATILNGRTILATTDAGEPFMTCSSDTIPRSTVWYRFTAPASGKVRISTASNGGTLTDTKLMVYSATNPANYSTYTAIGCDDDNGGAVSYKRSLLYLAALQPSFTYYIQVARKSATDDNGTFCITVDEVVDSMISTTGDCVYAGNVATWGGTAWVSLVDAQGKLVSNMKLSNKHMEYVESPAYIHTGATRSYQNRRFLNRNYRFFTTTAIAATQPVKLQLFFRQAEWNALITTAPNTSLTNVSLLYLKDKECSTSYQPGNITPSTLPATASALVNGIGMFQTEVTAPGAIYIAGTSTTAIGNISSNEQDVQLYPNPARDQLSVRLYAADHRQVTIAVLDITGRLLASTTFSLKHGSNELQLDVRHLTPGSYILQITGAHDESGKWISRFVKQ